MSEPNSRPKRASRKASQKTRRKRAVGEGLARSESMPISVRVDPETRYLIELAAQSQHRSMSGFIESLIHDALDKIEIGEQPLRNIQGEFDGSSAPIKLRHAARDLWHPNEIERFLRLAWYYPDLLTYKQSSLWRVIEECDACWNGKATQEDGEWRFDRTGPIPATIKTYWDRLQAVAAGEADADTLPYRDWSENEGDEPPTSIIIDPLASESETEQ